MSKFPAGSGNHNNSGLQPLQQSVLEKKKKNSPVRTYNFNVCEIHSPYTLILRGANQHATSASPINSYPLLWSNFQPKEGYKQQIDPTKNPIYQSLYLISRLQLMTHSELCPRRLTRWLTEANERTHYEEAATIKYSQEFIHPLILSPTPTYWNRKTKKTPKTPKKSSLFSILFFLE